MSVHFIIDGYNLIKQAPHLKNLNLEDSRQALIRILSIHQPQRAVQRNRITIVFDGKEGNFYSRQVSPVEIVFTQGESADERIKWMVENSKNPKTIVVVTNDREIQSYARQHQAQVKTVEEFLVKFNAAKTKDKVDDKAIGPAVTARITEEMKKIWLR